MLVICGSSYDCLEAEGQSLAPGTPGEIAVFLIEESIQMQRPESVQDESLFCSVWGSTSREAANSGSCCSRTSTHSPNARRAYSPNAG